ncbi:DNA topoisomerase I [Myxozyma melibiosi]|uniref:DNA topoisomerase I n=1 Tax=Myxozyma melibiosi TaxID=54550 RepID=A0ABR1F2L2_9ASCO
MSDSSDDDIPLSKRSQQESRKRKLKVEKEESDFSDDEVPLKIRGKKAAAAAKNKSAPVAKKPKAEPSDDSHVSTAPVKKNGASNGKANGKVKAENGTAGAKSAKKRETKKGATPVDEDGKTEQEKEEEEAYKWWEAEQNDGTVKWTTLSHKGVLFPPPYEPLPKHVKMKYDGKPVDLPVAAEEVAGFFGAMLESDHAKNPVFQKNFFNDFKAVLKKAGGANVAIESFEKCDFTDMFNYFEEKRLEKKNMSAAEKKRIKAEKDKIEEEYKVCYLDGRKEVVGNFRIEPPGLFRGRGSHPKTGKLKSRVMPEQVTINIGAEAEVPKPPEGHEWAEVKHDNTVSWLATWKENINGATKYVFLAANSSLKGMSDFKKFEKARQLKNHIDDIRQDYRRELKDEKMVNRQRATAMYLIDVLALRAGGEKGEDEADTVGCCSLRYEHVTFKPPNIVVFDFLGKDSIRFYQEVKVDHQVYKNLKLFKRPPKREGDELFDRLDPPSLNKHLQNYMPGLTAKVFRTYNASKTMQDQLGKIPNKGTVNEKMVAFNAANRAVAILCNHQRTVSKSHEQSVGKIEDKILEIKFQRYRLKMQLAQLEPARKKKDPAYFERDAELTDEVIDKIIDNILTREREKIVKKVQRDNEKRAAEGETKLSEKEVEKETKEKLKAVSELEAVYAKEKKSSFKMPEVTVSSAEKVEQQIEKLNERITNTTLQLKDKEDNSTVALTTSKINYIDPRLTVMFSKKYSVPIEKLFSKTLREKFKWAIESADEKWVF